MISAPVRFANAAARADLPLAVGPAISQTPGVSNLLDPMRCAVTLVSPDPAGLEPAREALRSRLGDVKSGEDLGPGAADLEVATDDLDALRGAVAEALAGMALDSCVQPAEGRRKRLMVADMDSTIISCECLDELADYAGVKAEIAAVTERAMRGELEFEPALRARVARLKGLPLDALRRCFEERVRLNPGRKSSSGP